MKVCFVGTGSIGKRHIRNLLLTAQQEGFSPEIHLLRSTRKPLEPDIQDAAARICYSTSGLDARYDAVFITNPTHLHYPVMLGLRDRADCFFVEKPVFDRTDLPTAPFEGAVCYVACPLRFTRVLTRARALLQDKQVRSVRAVCSSYLPDWRPAADYRDCYSAHRDQGGGVRLDLIHEWDYLTHLFGFPERVMLRYGKYSALEIDSEDLAVYLAEYPDKLLELHLDYFGRYAQRYCEAFTDDAVYRFDLLRRCIYRNGSISEQFTEATNDMYLAEMAYFCKLVQGTVPNVNPIAHALRTMQVASGTDTGRHLP